MQRISPLEDCIPARDAQNKAWEAKSVYLHILAYVYLSWTVNVVVSVSLDAA